MLEKLISIFKKIEKDNETYASEFLEFYKKCIEDFPKTLKNELKKSQIHPCTNQNTYYLCFTLADFEWWKLTIENEPLYFKEPNIIKNEIVKLSLEIFDKMEIPDEKFKEYAKELLDA